MSSQRNRKINFENIKLKIKKDNQKSEQNNLSEVNKLISP